MMFFVICLSIIYNKEIKLHLRKIYEREIPMLLGLDPLEFEELEESQKKNEYIYDKVTFQKPRFVKKITSTFFKNIIKNKLTKEERRMRRKYKRDRRAATGEDLLVQIKKKKKKSLKFENPIV